VSGVAVLAATEVIDALTGLQFGECQLTIRPCRRQCDNSVPGNWWEWGQWPKPIYYNGIWTNLTCGGCTDNCSCTAISEVFLPAPVVSVDEVKIDGVVLPITSYRLDNWRKLVRTDGYEWPACNDLNLDDTEINTWSIKITVGKVVPTMGKIAVGELAAQIAKLLACETQCALPKNVQQLIRQGVTQNFLDPVKMFATGLTGLYLVDLFIRTVNPDALRSRSRVYSVDGDNYRIAGT
jgi:hypothetical protein